jgi:short subunit dehydrogenase-like uncharacterized protein
MGRWLIYGANGYTGRLIAEQAVAQGLRPVLAGRGASVAELARQLGLDSQLFDLTDPDGCRAALAGASLLLNCAGPFSATAAPLMAACLACRCHYLDITGEIEVFEAAHALDTAARGAGVALCPGVGFDVVPTDCIAAALVEAMPDATDLALGFDSRSPLSPGTMKTAVEGMAQGGWVRRAGKLTPVPLGYRTRTVDFGFGPKQAVTIPWGDVATAYYTTGIGNIECYLACPPAMVGRLRRLEHIRGLLGWHPLQRLMKWHIGRSVRGPDQAGRDAAGTAVWGEVRNAGGQVCSARVKTANGYSLTIDSALALCQRLLEQPLAAGGYYTPSGLAGWRLVETLPGSSVIELSWQATE